MNPTSPNPFAPGSAGPGDDASLDDPPKGGVWVTLAAIAVGMSALFAISYAGQLIVFVHFFGWVGAVPWVFLALGASLLVLSGFLSQSRAWAALIAAVLCVAQAPIALVWNVYVLTFPLISPLGVLWLLTTVPAAILAAFAILPAGRITAYRRRLMA